jgi:hypothetical protein
MFKCVAISQFGSNETNAAVPLRVAGTFSNLGVSIDNTGSGRVAQFRKNGANGNQVVSLPNTTAVIQYDITHTDHLNVADTWDVNLSSTGSAAPLSPFIGVVFTADSGHAAPYGCSTFSTTMANPQFLPCTGGGDFHDSTEANCQTLMRTSGTFKNMLIICTTNNSGVTTTVTSRKNGANGNQSTTIAGGATGQFEDTTHSDSFVSGDKLNASITGVPAAATMAIMGCSTIVFTGTAGEISTAPLGLDNTFGFNASDNFWAYCGGALSFNVATSEGQYQQKHFYSGIASHMRQNVTSNDFTGTLTVALRKNGADANQSVAIGTTLTGWFEDTTHTDSFLGTDLMNYVVRGGVSSTSGATLACTMMTESPPIPPTVPQVLSYNIM